MKNTLLITAAGLGLFAWACAPAKQQKQKEIGANLPSFVHTIDNKRDTLLFCPKGTRLWIPKNCFKDASGSPVEGSMQVRVKEALHLEDIMLSGLDTRSNGELLQTGGMVYVEAKMGDNILEIREGKGLLMSIPQYTEQGQMMHYKGEINPETGQMNWVNPQELFAQKPLEMNGVENPKKQQVQQPKEAKKQNLAPIAVQETDQEPLLPPQKFDAKDKRTMSLEFDKPEDYPELAHYDKVRFRVSDQSKIYAEDHSIVWDNVELKKTDKAQEYIIVLEGEYQGKAVVRNYLVQPVLDGKDYEKAYKEYLQKKEAKEAAQKAKEKAQKEEQEKLEMQQKEELALADKKFQEEQLALMQKNQKEADSITLANHEQREASNLRMKQRLDSLEAAQKAYLEKVYAENQAYFDSIDNIVVPSGLKMKIEEPALQKALAPAENQYTMRLSSMGWQNVDMPLVTPNIRPVIISAKCDEVYEDYAISLAVPRTSIALHGQAREGDVYHFTEEPAKRKINFPYQQRAVLIFVGYRLGRQEISLHSFSIQKDTVIQLKPVSCTEAERKTKIQNLLAGTAS